MTKREEQSLITRMVELAKLSRAHKSAFTKDLNRAEATGLMRAARMVKGYSTQARFKWMARRAA